MRKKIENNTDTNIINSKHQYTISEISNPKINNIKFHNAILFGINVPEEALET